MNMSHQLISGKFLFSRKELTDAQVAELMPPSAIKSSQDEAYSRYLRYKRLAFLQQEPKNVFPFHSQKEDGAP